MSAAAIYPSLKDRAVFISGGGSGIGAALVQAFAAQGARVAFCDIADTASQHLAEVTGAHYLHADVTDIAAYQAAIHAAAELIGPIRILVNNAACDDRHKIEDVTADYWDRAIAVNLRHHFFAAQATAPMMESMGGGAIINMGSISWMRGRDGFIAYATAKAAITGMTRSMAREFGARGIRVNCLAPGAIVTERQKALWLSPDEDQKFLDLQCLKFRLQPSHVTRAALFLASDESSGMTGQTMIVDGGIV